MIYDIGIDKLVEDWAPTCVSQEASTETARKMIKEMSSFPYQAKVLMQIAAIVDAGRPFYQSTYILEGKSPLVFTTHIFLSRLDATVNGGLELSKI